MCVAWPETDQKNSQLPSLWREQVKQLKFKQQISQDCCYTDIIIIQDTHELSSFESLTRGFTRVDCWLCLRFQHFMSSLFVSDFYVSMLIHFELYHSRQPQNITRKITLEFLNFCQHNLYFMVCQSKLSPSDCCFLRHISVLWCTMCLWQ